VAILFADSFNSYVASASLNAGGNVSAADGLVKAGYAQPYELPGSNRFAAGLFLANGKLNNGNSLRLCWQNANANSQLNYTPPTDALALKRKFSFHWERFICLSTQIKLSKTWTQTTGLSKIPLIKFGPVTVYVVLNYDTPNAVQYYSLYANDSAQIGRMDSTQWSSLDIEINREEKKLRVWLANAKVWEVDSDYFTTTSFEYIGMLRAPNADSATLTAHVGYCDLDSIIIQDGSGPRNNTRTTSLTAKAISPDSASVAQFAYVGNASQLTSVSDTAKSNTSYDTNYRTSPTLAAYDLAKVSTPGEIAPLAVQVSTVARGEGADAPPVKLTTRFNNGSLTYKKPQPHAGVWRQQKVMFDQAPDNSNWSVAQIPTLEFGYAVAPQSELESLVNGGFEYLVFGAPGNDLFDLYRGDVDPTYVPPSQVEYQPPLETLPNSGPGPKTLKGGTSRFGYFGTVPMATLFPTRPLERIVGLSAGNSVNTSTDWLKFIVGGKTLYIPKKPIRSSVAWADLYALGLVYGAPGNGAAPSGQPVDQDKKIVVAGNKYEVRLMTGAEADPTAFPINQTDPATTQNSEWSRLIYRVWESDPTATFWEKFTDSDLGVNDGGVNYLTWCREAHTFGAGYRAMRGYPGLTGGTAAINTYVNAPPLQAAWRPVLEYLGTTTDPDTPPLIPDPPVGDPTMGPKTLVGGDLQAGYYGLLSQTELGITNVQLAALVGVTDGTDINTNGSWLKFSWKGKTIFTPQAPIRRNVLWQNLYQLGLVYGVDAFGAAPSGGNKNQLVYVDLGGFRFKIRLMNGSDTNPSSGVINSTTTQNTDNCEWDNTIERVYSGTPANLRWASFTDAELGSGSSDITICQENHTYYGGTTLANTPARVVRGYPNVQGMSVTQATTNGGFGAYASWRPVLEYVGPAPVAGYTDPTWAQMSFAEGIPLDDVSESPLATTNAAITANKLVNTTTTDVPLDKATPVYFSANEDFSIEGWGNFSSISTAGAAIICMDNQALTDTNRSFNLFVDSTLTVGFMLTSTGAYAGGFSNPANPKITLNSDNHFAACRVSGTLKMYLNGVEIFSAANVVAAFKTTMYLGIRQGAIGKRWNMRVMRGKSAYNGAFTPPASLPAIVVPTYDSSVAADIVFQTCFRRNSLYDEVSQAPLALSGTGIAVANGRLNITQTGSAARFQKFIPYFGAGDYTIEAIVRVLSTAGNENCVMGQYVNPGQNNSWLIWYSAGGGIIFYSNSTANGLVGLTATKVIPFNVDVHLVIEKYKGVLTIYMDGVACGTVANTQPLSDNSATIPVRNWWGDNSMSNSMSIKHMRIAKRAMYKGVIKPAPTLPKMPQAAALPLQGPTALKAGDAQLGYYGTLTSSAMLGTLDAAALIGLTVGTPINPTTDWLKFAYKGKILFVPKMPLRRDVTWNDIYAAGAVYGVAGVGNFPATPTVTQNRTITIGGNKFLVRLFKGADADPCPTSQYAVNNVVGTQNSEWTQLMQRVWDTDPTATFWEKFTAAQMGTTIGATDCGAWCQEQHPFAATTRVLRNYRGLLGMTADYVYSSGAASLTECWWPVFEYVP
jgi:hypothetical protein